MLFPDDEFEGVVSSISPATGSTFSLLPPDNASGNFVKVVQRVPVKITFKDLNLKLPKIKSWNECFSRRRSKIVGCKMRDAGSFFN